MLPFITAQFVAVLIILNPISKIFIFDALAKDLSPHSRLKQAIYSGMAMACFMLAAEWLGIHMLHALGIAIGDFKIAGGIIVFMTGIQLLKEKPIDLGASSNFSVVPFAFPLTVGPGTLSVIITLAHEHDLFTDKLNTSIMLLLVSFLVMLTLLFSKQIINFLPRAVVGVCNKLLAVVMMTIAIGMVRHGILFHSLAIHHINLA